MYLKASQSFEEVRKAAESALCELKYEYTRNQTPELVEFEVMVPAYLRVVIEPRKDPEVHNFILPSIKSPKGSTIEVRFGLDATASELEDASERASLFLYRLAKSFRNAPWEGLRSRESGRERKKWKEALGRNGIDLKG